MATIPYIASSRRLLDSDAVRDIAPAAVAAVPFGVIVGVTVAELGIGLGPGLGLSFGVYSGSAQMTVMGLIAGGAGPVAILLTLALTNARMLVYGAALAPLFRRQSAWFRWLGPHVIIDQTFVISMARTELHGDPRRFRRYWITAGAVLTAGWLAAIAVGMVLGPVLPAGSPLEVAMPALFIGLTAPKLRDRGAWPVAAAAALVAAAAIGLPRGTGVILAITVGGLVAAFTTARASRKEVA